MSDPARSDPARPTPLLTARAVGWGLLLGMILLAVLIGIAWRTTSVAWFLLFPLLLIGVIFALGVGVLWGLRHF